jgi:hypothetical protein
VIRIAVAGEVTAGADVAIAVAVALEDGEDIGQATFVEAS